MFPAWCHTIIHSFCRQLSDVPYEIIIHTSDVSGAGTSADVFLVICGVESSTEEVVLAKKKKESFKRGNADMFVKEVCHDMTRNRSVALLRDA